MKQHTVNSPFFHLEHFKSLKNSNLIFYLISLNKHFLRESELLNHVSWRVSFLVGGEK